MSSHVEWVKLVEYHENLLSPEERAEVEDHIAGSCDFCRGRLRQLREVTSIEDLIVSRGVDAGEQAMGSSALPETPPELISRAYTLFAQRQDPLPQPVPALPKRQESPRRQTVWTDTAAAWVSSALGAGLKLAPAPGGTAIEKTLARGRWKLALVDAKRFPVAKALPAGFRQRMEFQAARDLAPVLDTLERHREARDLRAGALFLARTLRDKPSEAVMLRELGGSYFKLGEFRLSLGNYSRALALAEKMALSPEMYANTRNIGCVYSRLGEHQKAVAFFERAINLARGLNQPLELGVDLHNLSIGYRNLGRFEEATQACEEALSLERKRGDTLAMAFSLTSKSNILSSLGRHEEAIRGCLEAKDLFQRSGHQREMGMCWLNIANSYNELARFSEAREACGEALVLKREAEDHIGVIATLIEMGRAQRGLGEPREAFETHRKAELLANRLDNGAVLGEVMEEMTQDLLSLADFDQALEYGSRALALVENTEDDVLKLKTYFHLAKVYRAKNDLPSIRPLYERARGIIVHLLPEKGPHNGAAPGSLHPLDIFQQDYPSFLEGLLGQWEPRPQAG